MILNLLFQVSLQNINLLERLRALLNKFQDTFFEKFKRYLKLTKKFLLSLVNNIFLSFVEFFYQSEIFLQIRINSFSSLFEIKKIL
jgi:hypothetical protein